MGSVEQTGRELGTLARQLHDGELGMPEIQRDFVWNRPQICRFLESLYRGFPFGTMLFWKTSDAVPVKSTTQSSAEDADVPVEFVLDGQQRITAIRQVMFDSDVDIMFNVDEERFDVHKRAMDGDPSWIAVRELWNTDPSRLPQSMVSRIGPTRRSFPRVSAGCTAFKGDWCRSRS